MFDDFAVLGGGKMPSDDNLSRQEDAPRYPGSHARRGAFIGSVLGLLAVWWIMADTFDANDTEHEGVYAIAMTIYCTFAAIVFLSITLAGLFVGWCFKHRD